MTELAILGGPKTVTVNTQELWKRPVEEEKKAVCELLDKGAISGAGKGVFTAFEDEFREYLGCKYLVATSHGHLALASAFFAAGLGAGDEFIHPAVGYIGSYAGALHMGAKPIFCEPDPMTLLADPADIEKRITPKTRVITPIHYAGRVCDLDSLLALCDKHNLVLVEDAAHAHGSEWDDVKIGNAGHVACFSLQGVDPGGKPITSGEGGVLATNDRKIYERALAYCHLHRSGINDEFTDPTLKKLEYQVLGWKWRAHPLGLAVARVSLKSLQYRISQYAANRDAFHEKIKGVPGIEPVHNYPKASGSELYDGMCFLYDSDALGGLPVKKFCEALQAEGASVWAGMFRPPEHLRSIYTEDMPGLWGEGHAGPANIPLPRYTKGDFPIAEAVNDRTVGMCGWIEATDGVIDQFADAIKKVFDQHKKLLET